MYIETPTGSWRWDLERPDEIRQMSSLAPSFFASTNESFDYEINPTGFLKVENQAQLGSCRGHSGSSCLEMAHVISGGKYRQFSRMCCYIETQRIDGIRGDQGSTIAGGVKLLTGQGICSEEDWPYTGQYSQQRPNGYDQMKKWTVEKATKIDSADAALKHLNYGPVDIGIMWGSDMDAQASRGAIIESYSPGRGGGGHAIAILGRVKTWMGKSLPDWHLLLMNSWSQNWGYRGWVAVSKRAFDAMANHQYNEMVGYFGRVSPEEIVPFPS